MDGEELDRPTEAVAALFLDEAEPVSPPDTAIPVGTVIGGFAIDGLIGTGATGVVYAATHPKIGKRVAIKILRHDLCDDPTSVERFVLEARAVNEIGHPNIIDIFDLGTLGDGRQYLIMDLLAGRPLRKRLAAGPLHVSEAAAVIDDCASALIAAHAKGFVHRDLKPDNVFLVEVPGRRPEVRLLDFGVVKLVEGAHPEGAGVRTRRGAVIGTPQYMSPEQARARNVDHRTDIYALGVMSFELLAGRRPFDAPSVLDLLIAHTEAPIPALRDRVPAIPVEVAQLVEAMLAKRADDRPTLAAVRTVIKRLVGSVIPTYTEAQAQLAAGSAPLPSQREAPARPAEVSTRHDRPDNLATTLPFDRPPLPKAIPTGTPATTAPVDEAAVDSMLPPPSSSRMWILFVVAAIGVIVGGLLLGMSL